MGNRLIASLALLACLTLSASVGAAPPATNPDNNGNSGNNNSGPVSSDTTSGFGISVPINVPPCKAPSGGMSLCRWDNIQVEYLNTRLNSINPLIWTTLVIKGKDREINLTYKASNTSVANLVASCERMATSSLGGLGLLSFYANVLTVAAGAEVEAGFNANKVTIMLDTTPLAYFEVGCFLTPGS